MLAQISCSSIFQTSAALNMFMTVTSNLLSDSWNSLSLKSAWTTCVL